MANGRVLLTENDRNMRTLLYELLTKAGFAVTSTIESGLSAELINRRIADVALLCVHPGSDYCQRLLAGYNGLSDIPIVVVLSLENSGDYSKYISLGADAVMIKPLDIEETVLRLNSIIRRNRASSLRSAANPVTLPDCGITVDLFSYTVSAKGRQISLPPKEIEILNLLLTNPNRVFRRSEIVAQVWGESLANERTIDTHIARIKKALGKPFSDYIKTVRGVGYKLSIPSEGNSEN